VVGSLVFYLFDEVVVPLLFNGFFDWSQASWSLS